MRIGFDIDGVLANFVKHYQELTVAVTGNDLFHVGDLTNPPCWDWPELRGYTKEEMSLVWGHIKRDETFWLNLPSIEENVDALGLMLRDLEMKHEVYYVTSRVGVNVKRQTKLWLIDKLRYLGRVHSEPTVLISGEKGEIAHALKLDAYIDDNYDNVRDVVQQSPATTTYLLNRSYNEAFTQGIGHIRVPALAAMLDAEIAKGRL